MSSEQWCYIVLFNGKNYNSVLILFQDILVDEMRLENETNIKAFTISLFKLNGFKCVTIISDAPANTMHLYLRMLLLFTVYIYIQYNVHIVKT